jgi:uncharacterized protein YkwD
LINSPNTRNTRIATLVRAGMATLAIVAGGLSGFSPSAHSTAQAATINCTVSSTELPADQEEQNMLNLINTFRSRPYTWSTTLSGAAIWMAHDMANRSRLSHIDSYNRDVRARLTDCGYPATAPVGEDITAGMTYMFGDMATLSNWMFNSADWQLLVSTQYTAIGIGRAYGPYSTDKWYWVVVVGTDDSVSLAPPATPVVTATATRTATSVATATAAATATRTATSIATAVATTTATGTPVPTAPATRTATPVSFGASPTPMLPTATTIPSATATKMTVASATPTKANNGTGYSWGPG